MEKLSNSHSESNLVLKRAKPTLESLLTEGKVLTGKEVIQSLKEKERQQKEFEESVEIELRNRRGK